MQDAPAIGLDFGTTNSALAWVDADGRSRLARFASSVGSVPSFRSVLYFERGEDGEGPLAGHAGPAALERYLASEQKTGRLIQSLKSFLANRGFRSTAVFGRAFRLGDLVGRLLGALREAARDGAAPVAGRVVVGRPVHFVRASDEHDETLALRRLEAGLRHAGFSGFDFELEPVGAAYHYERDLERDELVLIADFGGGTSDFSLLRVGPSFRERGRRRGSILGHAGVPLAGDAFDGKLMRHLVAPHLGRGAEFRSSFGRVLPVPVWLYSQLERWHHVSFLKAKRTLELLLDLRREALEPEKLEALWRVVDEDLGFLLFRSIEAVKCALSEATRARFHFAHAELEIEAELERATFEGWIEEELAALGQAVDGLLARAGVAPDAVERAFLTGGSSFVPAVRRLFEERFGAERVRTGDAFDSVASGLALRAHEGRRA